MTIPIILVLLLAFLVTQTDEHHVVCTRRTLALLAFMVIALLSFGATRARAQSGRTFYIDFSSGSNSQDGTEKTHTTGITGPWKSAPGMPTASGCTTTGSGPSYVHQAGDHFIFKGGVTWPAACFEMVIVNGGSSASTVSGPGQAPTINGADYYGTDHTWFTGGSYTQPKFDPNGSFISGNAFSPIISTASYITIDDIELAHAIVSSGCGGANICFDGSSQVGVTVNRMYIHDWAFYTPNGYSHETGAVAGTIASSPGINVYNTTWSDQNPTTNGGTGVTTSRTGACVVYANEVAWDTCTFTAEGYWGVGESGAASLHDSQVHDLDGTYVSTTGTHTNTIEMDFGGHPASVYNMYMYNNLTGFNVICPGTAFYNNVIHIQAAGTGDIVVDTNCAGVSTATQTLVANNTIDTNNGPYAAINCIRIYPRTAPPTPVSGVVTIKNNICIGAGGIDTSGATQTPVVTNNLAMSNGDATNFGFVPGNKYKPSSSDPAVTGAGLNLSSSCSGLAALCSDTSGAPWFGGSPIARGSSWDMGAFKGLGGTTGPPTLSITSPSPGTVSGSVNLQSTCTPQGTATCTSVQYSIDGFPFGAAQTVSPYTLAWNTATAANANHIISAVATDSNGNTGSASPTVTVTVSNSIPGCFVSNSNFSSNQSFTPQTSGTQTYTFTVTPNTAGNAGDTAQDTPIGLSQVAATGYSQFAAIVRASTSNVWDAYDGALPGYRALNSAPYTPGTVYTFAMTPNLSASPQTYNLSETSPSSIVIATNFQLRLAVTSLGFINANSSNNSTPDTVKVCGFQAGSGTSLSFNPPSLNFGNVNSGSNASLSATVTSANGSTSFTSITVAGTGFTKTADTCSTNTVASCSFTVQFAPSSTGNFNGTATLVDSATGSPQVVNLSGTGTATASSATPSPTSLNFGNVQLGLAGGATSGPVTMNLMNGPVTFAVPAVTFDNPDFSVAAITCSGSVSAPSCQITPRFIPSSLSNETATMTVHDDAPTGGSTQTVALQGVGVNFPTIAPATQFVFQDNFPVTFTIRGKTYTYIYTGSCNCQWVNSKWGCVCE